MEFTSEIDLFEYMEQNLYADALSDILDEMGYRECVVSPHAMIRPLYAEAVCTGRVRTALNAPAVTGRDDPYKLGIELMDTLKPGEVATASSDKLLEVGIMGELSASRMSELGVRGCVVDGYTRDARKIIQQRFPTFVRGCSPIDTIDRSKVVDYDCPIIIGGRRVLPGQIVFADLDGIVFIPREIETEVLEKAVKRVEAESKVREKLRNGATMREMWDTYHIL